MNAPSRVETLSATLIAPRRLGALAVLSAAQIIMLVANLGRIPVLSTGDRSVPITLNEMAVGLVLATGFVVVVQKRRFVIDRVALLAMVFAAIGAVSAAWSMRRFGMSLFELLISLAYLARWLMYFAIYLVVINVARAGSEERLWSAVETMLVLFAVFGIFQSAFLPGFAQMVYPDSREYIDWDVQGHRLVSTVLEPNIAGAMLTIGLLVQLARVSVGARVSHWRILVLFTAVVLTLSRSAAVGLFMGALTLILARGLSRRVMRLAAAGAVVILLASPLLLRYAISFGKFTIGSGTSAGARVESWLLALQVIRDHPVLGVGFNAYKYAAQFYGSEQIGASSYGADGGLLFILAMTGVVGLSVYLLMTGYMIARCRSIWRDAALSPEARGLALGTAAATVAVVVLSAFVNAILTTFVMQMLWMLWGITFITARARIGRRSADRGTPLRVVAAPACT
jgi:O-antigen ligase